LRSGGAKFERVEFSVKFGCLKNTGKILRHEIWRLEFCDIKFGVWNFAAKFCDKILSRRILMRILFCGNEALNSALQAPRQAAG